MINMKPFDFSSFSTIMIILFTFIIDYVFIDHEIEIKENNYNNQAMVIFNEIENKMFHHEATIASIQSLFNASNFVSLEEFEMFAYNLISEEGIVVITLDNKNRVDYSFSSSELVNPLKELIIISESPQGKPTINIANFTTFIAPLSQDSSPYLGYLISDEALLSDLNLVDNACIKLIEEERIIETKACANQSVSWPITLNSYNQNVFFYLPTLNKYYSISADFDLSWQEEYILFLILIFITFLGFFCSCIIHNHLKIKQKVHSEKIESDVRIAILSSINHEIRTPINAVIYFSEKLKREASLTSDVEELVESIIWSANMLNSVAENSLDYSCSEAGHLVLNHTATDLFALLNQIREYYRSYTFKFKKKLVIHSEHQAGVMINLDSSKFFQLITNIINNAFKYSSGTIVDCYITKVENSLGSYIRVAIQDYGKGMNISSKVIFASPFNTGGVKSRVGGQKAIGIGLYMCKKILQNIGGQINMRSKINKGTIVIFRFPYSVRSEPYLANSQSLQGKSVAVIDDDLMNLELCQTALKELGLSVTVYSNGESALASISNKNTDFLISDYVLPDINGIDLIEKIMQKNDAVHYFILSANDQSEIAKDNIFPDITFMKKPFSKEQFLMLTATMVSKTSSIDKTGTKICYDLRDLTTPDKR